MSSARIDKMRRLLSERILIKDGAMGTMIQGRRLSEEDFRGRQFADHPCDLKGCNDILTLTQPELIKEIHREFLEAGPAIIGHTTFKSTSVSLSDCQA